MVSISSLIYLPALLMEFQTRPSPAAADAVLSQVLDDSDLLNEILLRVGFPTTLVRAALVCKRWLGHVSDRAFLRRFRELHPPRLLGFYIMDYGLSTDTPHFVPVLPQPPELAAVVIRRRASFNLSDFSYQWNIIHDCRNGSVLQSLFDSMGDYRYRVHNPLCPARNLDIPEPPQVEAHGDDYVCEFNKLLSREESDGSLCYFYLQVDSNFHARQPGSLRLHVYMLQDGLWRQRHLLCIVDEDDQIPRPLYKPRPVLVGDKIYMAAGLSSLIVLDLTTSSFSTIQLPPGVDHGGGRRGGTTLLSRPHDANSGVYLAHVKEFQLCIWLHNHKGDNGWRLVDAIHLRDMCDELRKSDCTIEDENNILLMVQEVDYCGFLFLKMGECVLHLDIKRKTLCKVYATQGQVCRLGDIHPVTMLWPPKFPHPNQV